MSDISTNERDPELDKLLPWYVNGTLDDEERARVEAYLAKSTTAADEVELLRRLRAQVKADQPEQTPGELGLRRLQQQVSRERRATLATSPGWWRPAAIAATLVIVVQGAVLFQSLPEGGVTPAGLPRAEGTVVQVTFAGEATEEQIRAALQAVNGTFIGGPGALGVYSIRLKGIEPADSAAFDEAIETLEAQVGVVANVSVE